MLFPYNGDRRYLSVAATEDRVRAGGLRTWQTGTSVPGVGRIAGRDASLALGMTMATAPPL